MCVCIYSQIIEDTKALKNSQARYAENFIEEFVTHLRLGHSDYFVTFLYLFIPRSTNETKAGEAGRYRWPRTNKPCENLFLVQVLSRLFLSSMSKACRSISVERKTRVLRVNCLRKSRELLCSIDINVDIYRHIGVRNNGSSYREFVHTSPLFASTIIVRHFKPFNAERLHLLQATVFI